MSVQVCWSCPVPIINKKPPGLVGKRNMMRVRQYRNNWGNLNFRMQGSIIEKTELNMIVSRNLDLK